jgi:hypothetical protein
MLQSQRRDQRPLEEPAHDARLGNVRETFAKFIRNGETVVSVRAVTDEDAEFAAETLRDSTAVATWYKVLL